MILIINFLVFKRIIIISIVGLNLSGKKKYLGRLECSLGLIIRLFLRFVRVRELSLSRLSFEILRLIAEFIPI